MRKTLFFALCLVISLFAFVSCKPVDSHTHTFDQKNVGDIYRKSKATEDAPAEYYYSCSCGEKGEETFTFGSPDEPQHTHVYDQKNTSKAYLMNEASLKVPAKYYYSCSCGEKGTDVFTHGDVLDPGLVFVRNPDLT